MNKIFVCLFCLAALFQSCGKYGYHFEDGYNSEDKDGNIYDPSHQKDTRFLEKAKLFPGVVSDHIPRIKDTTVRLDFTKPNQSLFTVRTNAVPLAIQNTGLYAPAGEPIHITLPNNIQGVTVQIGVHTDFLTELPSYQREAKITTLNMLLPGENVVNNPFGGTILIQAEVAPLSAVIDVKIGGAVRSPDFIKDVTQFNAWLADIEKQDVPWVEFKGKYVAFSVPRTYILKYKNQIDPQLALEFWDNVYSEDFYKNQGYNANPGPSRLPGYLDRCVFDIQPFEGSHAGFPWMLLLNDENFLALFSKSQITNYNFKSQVNRSIFGFIGSNQTQSTGWVWPSIAAVVPNLFMYQTASRIHVPFLTADPAIQDNVQIAMDYVLSDSFKDIGTLAGDYPAAMHSYLFLPPFIQLFEKTTGKNGEQGWKLLERLYTLGRLSNMNFLVPQNQIDFFYKTICDFTGKDYQRFLKQWGIYPSEFALQEMRIKYKPLDNALWEYDPIKKENGDRKIDVKYDLDYAQFIYSSNVATYSRNPFRYINDKDYSTFWQTCIGNCDVETTLPVYVNIDLRHVESFKGLFYANEKNGSNLVKTIQVFTSNDAINWKLVKTFENLPMQNTGRIELALDDVVDSRYARIGFPENNSAGTPLVALSELGLFYDIKR